MFNNNQAIRTYTKFDQIMLTTLSCIQCNVFVKTGELQVYNYVDDELTNILPADDTTVLRFFEKWQH